MSEAFLSLVRYMSKTYIARELKMGAEMHKRFQLVVAPNFNVTGAAIRESVGTEVAHNMLNPMGDQT